MERKTRVDYESGFQALLLLNRLMKILYVCQYFPPEMGAPAARASELGKFWAQAGHDVTILTGFPNHPTGVLAAEYRKKIRRLTIREQSDGMEVVRTWLMPLPNRKSWERILNYSSFAISAALRGLFLKKFDVVIATSPQLLVGLSGLAISKVRRIPLIFEVRDLWPESLTAVGVSSSSSLLNRTLGAVSRALYRHSDRIVVVTPAFKRFIVGNYGVAPDKISTVMNGVDVEFFSRAAAKKQEGTKPFVVSFIGTMGNAHGLDVVVETARMLIDSHPDIEFRLIGEGAERARIERLVADSKLTNIHILGQQPRAKIPGHIADADVCLVLLKKSEVFKTVIPTKMLEFMACERPVILGVEGQAREILEEANGGVSIPPESPEHLRDAILALYADRDFGRKLGSNGRNFVFNRLSRERTAQDYIDVCQQLCT